MRSILTYALATLIAVFLVVLAQPQNSFAATWNGQAIEHEGNLYTGPAGQDVIDALNAAESGTVYPSDTYVLTYTDPDDAEDQRIRVIYFAPGVDPGQATEANYKDYTFNGRNNFSNPSSRATIGLTEPATDGYTACAVDGGLGYIICPVTDTLATWMDWVFGVLASFLEVRPIETGNQNNAIYRAWSMMQMFANVAFVIGFLIIIYSQITSVGLSSYSMKKLLPRLIIAAILVNVSYFICALAIDISNILGHSLQSLFIGMRNFITGDEGNGWDLLSFESVASFVLAGGTAAIAGGAVVLTGIATYGVVGSLALLLPALVSGLLAVLVALLVMAGRQAIITILTILAPLAFVAFLLPNTEKWFDKWRGLFMTMLILFPAFSVIFGGSQFAASLIIQNATNINLVILAMLVQVAPLFITPLLIKFSGSLLGRLAGIVNNPNRGLVDRTRNFTKDRTEALKARRLASQAPRGLAGALQRTAQRNDYKRRRRDGLKSAYNNMADAAWANSADYSDIEQMNMRSADEKQIGETNTKLRYNQSKIGNAEIQQLDVNVRNANLNLDNAKTQADLTNWEQNHAQPILAAKMRERVLKDEVSAAHSLHDAEYGEFKTGEVLHLNPSVHNRELQERAMRNADMLSANAIRKAGAERVLTDQFTTKLTDNTTRIDGKTLQQYAAGIDPNGAQRAVAAATSAKSKAFDENVNNASAILSSMNKSDTDINDIALDKYTGSDIQVTEEMRLAAIRKITRGGNAKELKRFLENFSVGPGEYSQDIRQEIADNLLANGNKPKWVGAGVAAKIKDGVGIPNFGEGRTQTWIADAYNAGKLSSAQVLATQDGEYIAEIRKAFEANPAAFTANPEKLADFKEQLQIALQDHRYSGQLGERKDDLKAIFDQLT